MSTVLDTVETEPGTLHDLVRELGDVPLWRICRNPAPGTATEADVLRFADAVDKRLYELVDDTLVEKPMGLRESHVAHQLDKRLGRWNDDAGDLGMITLPDGTIKLLGRQVRIPDIAFTRWTRLPGGVVPAEPIPRLAPDLAVEVLSESNTVREMVRKRADYFAAGIGQVWLIDPDARTLRVYDSPDQYREFGGDDEYAGDPVLPGFRLRIADLFARMGPAAGG